ncbi:hypothetical protein BGZ80_002053, partial [Entomortierella chlamydospora]
TIKIDEETPPVPEAEVVALWKQCLEILSEGKLKLGSGEHICTATAIQKRNFLKLFNIQGDTENGRKPSEGVFLGGAACDEIINLPTTKDEFERFLSGPSISILCNYTRLLLLYQDDIKEQLHRKRSEAIMERTIKTTHTAQTRNGEDCSKTPPYRPFHFGDVTILTPKQRKKRTGAMMSHVILDLQTSPTDTFNARVESHLDSPAELHTESE